MNNRYLRILFLTFLSLQLRAQELFHMRNDLCAPLNVPLSISGNYGDVRASSFHFGIDYTTNGSRGLPVFAIDSGYVSRLKVEAGGYGKAIYITHASGITSVYAHLDSFSPAITRFVREKQYQMQSFAQDIMLEQEQFRVKKGEIIGYSGNSGQSTGPHLHFELRKTENQNTIQPYIFSFHPRDTIPPFIDKVLLYPRFYYLSKDPIPAISVSSGKNMKISSYKSTFKSREYKLLDSIWRVPKEFYIGILAYDKLEDNARQLSFYSSRVWLDTTLIFELVLDELPFSEMGWVNGLIDFQRKRLQKENIFFQFLYPGFRPMPVKKAVNNGLIVIKDTLVHQLTVEVADFTGNTAVMRFKVQRLNTEKNTPKNSAIGSQTIIPAGVTRKIQLSRANVIFFPNSLYTNSKIKVRSVRRSSLYIGYYIEVGHEAIPLKSPITLEFNLAPIPHQYWPKLRIVKLMGNGMESIGGEVDGTTLKAKTKVLGNFSLALDTIPPTIEFLNVKENATASKFIQARVRDNLAGIRSWAGYIDGQWVLFEYDKKNDELRYTFDEKCVQTNGLHRLELRVEDHCGNKTTKSLNFIY